MLKGIEFNSFGAFFSRAYRENDYLWGRLHGADRLIDIVASSVGGDGALKGDEMAALKRSAFHAILDAEEGRLPKVTALIAALGGAVGYPPHDIPATAGMTMLGLLVASETEQRRV